MNISKSILLTGEAPNPTKAYIFGVGGEASKTDRKNELDAWNTLGDLSHFGAGEGKKNIGQASNYWSDILSGDQKKLAAAIAPQTQVIQGQKQQQKNQLAEFGNRSGGTNASGQMIDVNADKAVQDLINTLIPQAASHLENIGGKELDLGASTAGTLGEQTEAARQADKASEAAMGGGIFSILKPVLKAGAGMIPGVGPLLSAGLGA